MRSHLHRLLRHLPVIVLLLAASLVTTGGGFPR